MSDARSERAKALEAWAERVTSGDLTAADTESLRTIAALVEQRDQVDAQIGDAVIAARRDQRSWAEIGLMLGVSKQAAHQKYGDEVSAEERTRRG